MCIRDRINDLVRVSSFAQARVEAFEDGVAERSRPVMCEHGQHIHVSSLPVNLRPVLGGRTAWFRIGRHGDASHPRVAGGILPRIRHSCGFFRAVGWKPLPCTESPASLAPAMQTSTADIVPRQIGGAFGHGRVFVVAFEMLVPSGIGGTGGRHEHTESGVHRHGQVRPSGSIRSDGESSSS